MSVTRNILSPLIPVRGESRGDRLFVEGLPERLAINRLSTHRPGFSMNLHPWLAHLYVFCKGGDSCC